MLLAKGFWDKQHHGYLAICRPNQTLLQHIKHGDPTPRRQAQGKSPYQESISIPRRKQEVQSHCKEVIPTSPKNTVGKTTHGG